MTLKETYTFQEIESMYVQAKTKLEKIIAGKTKMGDLSQKAAQIGLKIVESHYRIQEQKYNTA